MNFDWGVIWQYRGPLLEGTLLTILLTVLTMLIAVPAGIALALMRLSKSKVFSVASASFVEFFRNLPLILVISALSKLLYHWGVLQRIVYAIGWVLQRSLGMRGRHFESLFLTSDSDLTKKVRVTIAVEYEFVCPGHIASFQGLSFKHDMSVCTWIFYLECSRHLLEASKGIRARRKGFSPDYEVKWNYCSLDGSRRYLCAGRRRDQ